MKKCIIFALVALTAGIMQASSVDWSVAGNTFGKSPDDTSSNKRAKDYTVLIFNASDLSDVTSLLSSGDIAGAQAKAVSSGVTGSTGGTSGSFTSTVASGTTVSMFAVAFDSKTPSEAKNYLMGATISTTAYQPPATGTPAEYTSANFGGGSWTAVPEPCSVALLALGLAALGLKRKVA